MFTTKSHRNLKIARLLSVALLCGVSSEAIAQSASEMAQSIFGDSIKPIASFHNDLELAPNGDPSFPGTDRSIRAWPKNHDWAYITLSNAEIDGSNRYLHFYLRRGDQGNGKIKLIGNSYQSEVQLEGNNSDNWLLNGLVPPSNFSGLGGMPAHNWNHFSIDLEAFGINELNTIAVEGGGDNVIYYMDEVGLHTNKDLFTKSLFIDDFYGNTTKWIKNGNVKILTNQWAANGSKSSLFIQPAAHDIDGINVNENIDVNRRYLHFSFQRSPNSDGGIAIFDDNWITTYLDDSNNNFWTVNGEISTGTPSDLAVNQWHNITVDLQGLNIGYIRAMGMVGDENDGPTAESGKYSWDNVGLSATPFGFYEPPVVETVEAPNKCVNIGGFLESPVLDPENAIYKKWGYPDSSEGKPSMPIAHLQKIKDAGFDTIRLPVRWTRFAGEEANLVHGNDDHFPYGSAVKNPYSNTHGIIEGVDDAPIDTSGTSIFPIVDEIINDAQSVGLKVIVNVHLPKGFSFDRTEDQLGDLDNETLRLKAIWKQLATKYASEDDTLIFELLNEPNFGPDDYSTGTYVNLINDLNDDLINIIRGVEGNEDRWVIAGSSQYGGISPFQEDSQYKFSPPNDPKTIMTFHYYEPFDNFTHQEMNYPLFSNWGYENGFFAGNSANYSIVNNQTAGAQRSASYIAVEHFANWELPTFGFDDGTNVNEIGTDNRYLHLEVYREVGGSETAGTIRIQDQNWGIINLKANNAHLWTPNGMPLQKGLDELPSGEWHHLVVDLQKLGVTTLNGLGLQADENAGETYRLDEVGLHNSPTYPAPFDAANEQPGISSDFNKVLQFKNSVAPNMPVFVGEFGSNLLSDPTSRMEHAQTIREEAEARGFGWCSWDFGTYSAGGMAIFNPDTNEWVDGIKDALIPE